ncbi:MAG: hypothetical protein IPO71_13595 [Nitrosomonas sp.]|nr:hypothetical protein [Nitrosomonas sp.]
MFPDQPTVRDSFIRAVIRTNPELFPDGIYQPLPTGTTIFIPDLRTINTYSRSPSKAQKPSKADNIVDNQLPEHQKTVVLQTRQTTNRMAMAHQITTVVRMGYMN